MLSSILMVLFLVLVQLTGKIFSKLFSNNLCLITLGLSFFLIVSLDHKLFDATRSRVRVLGFL